MRITFLFAFYNRETERARRCLQSLAAQSEEGLFEIRLADFGSDQDQLEGLLVLEQTISELTVVRLHGQGQLFNKALCLNTAAVGAKGEHIVVGDIDLIYPPGFVHGLLAALPPGVFCNYRCYYGLPDMDYSAAVSSSGLAASGLLLSMDTGVGLACMPRAIFEHIGGYNTLYFLWGLEDLDMVDRSLTAGLRHTWLDATQHVTLHQWHPHAQGTQPRSWYQFFYDHYLAHRAADIAQPSGPDRAAINGHRPCLMAARAGSGWHLTIALEADLAFGTAQLYHLAQHGPAGQMVRVMARPARFGGRLEGLVRQANGLLTKAGLGYRLQNRELADLEAEPYVRLRDTIYYFLQISRDRLEDYHLAQGPEGMELIIQLAGPGDTGKAGLVALPAALAAAEVPPWELAGARNEP